jgi:hypothetical protein
MDYARCTDRTGMALALDRLLSKGVYPPDWHLRSQLTALRRIGRAGSGSLAIQPEGWKCPPTLEPPEPNRKVARPT